jgi:hypothetical protein
VPDSVRHLRRHPASTGENTRIPETVFLSFICLVIYACLYSSVLIHN